MNDDEQVHLLKTLLQPPIAFHRVFAAIAHGAAAGLLLSQAFYWAQRTKHKDGWFFKTEKEWTNEIALTRYELATARKALRTLGFLEEKRKGVPARLWYRVDMLAVTKAVSQLRKSSNQESGKAANKKAGKPSTGMPLFSNSVAQNQQTSALDSSNILITHRLHHETTAETTARARATQSQFSHAERLAYVLNTKPHVKSPDGLADYLKNGDDDERITAWQVEQSQPTPNKESFQELNDDERRMIIEMAESYSEPLNDEERRIVAMADQLKQAA